MTRIFDAVRAIFLTPEEQARPRQLESTKPRAELITVALSYFREVCEFDDPWLRELKIRLLSSSEQRTKLCTMAEIILEAVELSILDEHYLELTSWGFDTLANVCHHMMETHPDSFLTDSFQLGRPHFRFDLPVKRSTEGAV
jgi:hypothetical protein